MDKYFTALAGGQLRGHPKLIPATRRNVAYVQLVITNAIGKHITIRVAGRALQNDCMRNLRRNDYIDAEGVWVTKRLLDASRVTKTKYANSDNSWYK